MFKPYWCAFGWGLLPLKFYIKVTIQTLRDNCSKTTRTHTTGLITSVSILVHYVCMYIGVCVYSPICTVPAESSTFVGPHLLNFLTSHTSSWIYVCFLYSQFCLSLMFVCMHACVCNFLFVQYRKGSSTLLEPHLWCKVHVWYFLIKLIRDQ